MHFGVFTLEKYHIGGGGKVIYPHSTPQPILQIVRLRLARTPPAWTIFLGVWTLPHVIGRLRLDLGSSLSTSRADTHTTSMSERSRSFYTFRTWTSGATSTSMHRATNPLAFAASSLHTASTAVTLCPTSYDLHSGSPHNVLLYHLLIRSDKVIRGCSVVIRGCSMVTRGCCVFVR